jgi:tRNA pseudouridine32 synthase/23S rRNA pseudouridine746 synthase
VTRPIKLSLPLRDGVSASCVSVPAAHSSTHCTGLLIDFLVARMPGVGRDEWLARLRRGDVLDEQGLALPLTAQAQAGERFYYYRQLPNEAVIPFEAQILFQDELLLVADKPHFLPIMPAGRYVRETLLARLKQSTGLATLTPIHRLDRETAGLVLFSLQPATRGAYHALFRERSVEKVYEAIAPFRPDLSWPLTRRSRLQERADAFMQMEELAGEANAETQITLLAQHGELASYELRPLTGQKHQLRVHMNALGLPIQGDRIYPQLWPEQAQPNYSEPLQLLAKAIAFTDPCTGQRRVFETRLTLAGSQRSNHPDTT